MVVVTYVGIFRSLCLGIGHVQELSFPVAALFVPESSSFYVT